MIVIPVKDGENIDRALKRFKRKFERTQILKKIRANQAFTKDSIKRRNVILKAKYIQKIKENSD